MVNIRKRGKVYQYQFEIAKVDGKRKYISKSGFKTKNEALMAGMKAYDEYINGGNTKDSQMSYADYLDYWMKEYFEINYKYSTAKRYKETFKVLKEEIGKYKLSFITPFLLNQSLLKIAQKCKTKEGVRNYQKVIKSSFRDATNHFGFLKYNPAVELQIPKILSSETKKNGIKHIYSQEEIDKILLRFKNNNTFICAFLTACYTGMRTGEVFALTWDDIDLENKIIKINKTVYSKIKDDKGRWFLGTTKTNDSCRDVFICDTLYKILSNYKEKQKLLKKKYGRKYKKYELEPIKNEYGKINEYKVIESKHKNLNSVEMVFTKNNGSYVGTDIIKYPFKIIHNELGIKNCRFYDLRGSYATQILRKGAEIRDVADILGHSRIETTENYYIASSEKTRKEANNILEKIIQADVIYEVINY
ncbi:MAG: tyrosine-type recombinase/integrase [Clostridia bacterium]